MGAGRHQQEMRMVQQQQHHHQDQDAHHQGNNHYFSSSRNLRNRRFRRVFQDGHQTKRLFTPEIKRYLKSWLVRRRRNPYPSRSEKKELAFKTGLTYVQICNWFANWRRKLKNSSRGRDTTWGTLIRGYNVNAKGNVEQFSICSEDSIWQDNNLNIESDSEFSECYEKSPGVDHCYYMGCESCRSPNDIHQEQKQPPSIRYSRPYWVSQPNNRQSMCHDPTCRQPSCFEPNNNKSSLLTRWLESSARYATGGVRAIYPTRHKEELDAAEALTFLAQA